MINRTKPSAILATVVLSSSLLGIVSANANAPAFSGNVLIADEGNNRLVLVNYAKKVLWTFPQKGDLAPGQIFRTPDDVFFTSDGKKLVVTESENQMLGIIDIASRKITFEYGVSGKSSTKAGFLHNPDDAMMMSDGRIITADIANCRILFIDPATKKTTQFGKTGSCYHNPPTRYGSPNGAFPMANGNLLVTEINGDWVDEVTTTGKVIWSAHAPKVYYPSDSNEVSPDLYVTVDFVKNGSIVEFNSKGKLIWQYKPKESLALDHPSLATALPNKQIIATDDANHRIIVVDPATNKVVWQYGVKGKAGSKQGYLNNPDGLELAPANSELSKL